MSKAIIHILLHSLEETAKLLPFLFLTYLLLEWIEQKASVKTASLTAKAGKFGPAAGGILGVLPQCGFSASASNLYTRGIISVGTLISVYLSTSDEMLPVLISEKAPIHRILLLLGIKVISGIAIGFLMDGIFRLIKRSPLKKAGSSVSCLSPSCQDETCCCCQQGIFRSAFKHTLQIAGFVFLFSLIIGGIVETVGEETLAELASKAGIFSILLCGIIGMIPNCASSVVLTELFLDGVISTGSILAGLLAGSGVGLLILFRVNRNLKENLLIAGSIYAIGTGIGIFFDLFGIVL